MSATLPLLHRAWRHLPRGPRRAAFSAATGLLAPRLDRVPSAPAAGLAVAGELDRPSGLGEGARLMIRAMEALGEPCFPLCIGDRSATMPPPGVPVVVHANAPVLAAALLRLPRRLVRGRRVVGYWAWDLPVAPSAWRQGARRVHEVWVPSHFTAAALQPWLGCPLRCVPHPVAAAPIVPSRLGRVDFDFAPGTVVVLTTFSLSSSYVRKNPEGAIAAFRAAFGDRADRLLVIKLTDAGHFPRDAAALRQAVSGCANIRIDERTMPAADLFAMTACADMVLCLHRAEGFGLVPAEAMMLGTAVVATGWSGPMDYMDAQCAALVDYALVPAVDPRGVFEAPGALWAEPSVADAARQLRRLADDAPVRTTLAAAGAAQVRTRLGTGPLRAALRAMRG